MKSSSTIWVFSIAFVYAFIIGVHPAQADVEWSLLNRIQLDVTPLDLASSADGRWVYVLGPGEIEVYSAFDNRVVTHIPIERSYDKISYSASISSLLVSSSSEKSIKIIQLELINSFDFTGLASKGPADAPVTIAVFSDYQCPYCEKLFPVIQQVMDKYPSQVRLIVKNFPLPSHKFAQDAAIASLAANLQGKFWEFHDMLFKNMNALDGAKLKEIARELNLDLPKFTTDLKNSSLQDLINRDIVEGNRAEVGGTPCVFVNGKKLVNFSMQGFQTRISEILTKNGK